MADLEKKYRDRLAKIEKDAAPVVKWQAEKAALESEAAALADQRIEALTHDDLETADRLGSEIKSKQSRADDLKAMIERREAATRAALLEFCANESTAVTTAGYQDAQAALIEAQRVQGLAARTYQNAVAESLNAEAKLWAWANYQNQATDQKLRAAYVESELAYLLNGTERSVILPWLNGNGKEPQQ